MKHTLALVLGIAALGLSGCATQAPATAQASVPDDGADMRCEKVFTTGSNMPKTVCTTAADRRRTQQETDRVTEQLRSAPSVPLQRNPR